MSNQKPANSNPTPPNRQNQALSKATGPKGNVVGGDAKAVHPKAAVPKTTPKAKPVTAPSEPRESYRPQGASAQTGAQSTLEKAKQAVEQFAQVNAAQARDLGVQLADAEAAFPLTMMQGYHERKAEIEGAGLDAATFLSGLTQQVSTLRETSVTITLPAADGTALLPGTDPAA